MKNGFQQGIGKVSISIGILFLGLFSFAHAQPSGVTLSANPSIPEPNSEVLLTISSNSSVNLNKATINWYVDDELKLSGVGEDSARVLVGNVGETLRVRVVITAENGLEITRSISLEPLGLDLLWEAITYTPPFYAGKALSASGGLVSFVAIPNFFDSRGNRIDSSEIEFTWSQKGVVLGNSSGLGRDQIVLESPTSEFDTLQITVTASYQRERLTARRNAKVRISDPEIVFYENSPLQGVLYNSALSSPTVVDKENIVLRAEPYFFSKEDEVFGNLSYDWSIQGQSIDIPVAEQRKDLEIRSEGLKRSVNVALSIINNNLPFRIFQEAIDNILISFE